MAVFCRSSYPARWCPAEDRTPHRDTNEYLEVILYRHALVDL